jgi:cellulose synthase/poly-beta-1,6-N-acetylglucosamine synthase-like glycosyltransferase
MLHLSDVVVLVLYYGILAALAVYGLHRILMVSLYYRTRGAAPSPAAPLRPLPRVTVQLPVYNERYVVERLIACVARLDYPKDLLQIQVLDDSTDDTREIAEAAIRECRAQGLDIEHCRRSDRRGFKAGALQAGLATARGEFLLILDADFLPHERILRDSIDYFSDPRVGMVQSRWGHLNRGFSLLTEVQSIFLDGHFVIEHTARHRSGRFFNFNGTAGVWRRSAIESAGGWNSETLTEDLELSYRAQLAGWKFVYLKDLVSPAELPVDVNGFKTQQHRWAKGSIQTGRKLLPEIFRSRFPLRVKVESFFHLTGNASYLLVVALSFLVLPAMLIRHRLGWSRLIAFDFPLFLISVISLLAFYATSQREIDARWREKIRYFPILTSLGIGLAVNNAAAVLEALLGRRTEFRRTPKYSIVEAGQEWRHKGYRSRLSFTFPLEVSFAAYFAAAVAVALDQKIYLALPFLTLFLAGYLSMALMTILQLAPPLKDSRATAGACSRGRPPGPRSGS